MKKEKFVVIIAIILIGIAVSGAKCNLGKQGTDDEDVDRLAERDFRTGSEGIELEWLKTDLPDVIYDTEKTADEIMLIAEIRNRGAEDTTVELHLSGFDKNYIELPYTSGAWTFDLEGRSIRNSEGGFRILEIPGDAAGFDGGINLPRGVDLYKPRFQLTACYAYTTIASPMVCVDPDPYNIRKEKACKTEDVEGLGTSQGGPVSVTRVNVENIPNEVIFQIDISNSGEGRVYDKNFVESKCPGSLEVSDINEVEYQIFFQNDDISKGDNCNPSGNRVRLVDGKGAIFCTTSVSNAESAFKTPLKIQLNYGYMESIYEDIEIRRLKRD